MSITYVKASIEKVQLSSNRPEDVQDPKEVLKLFPSTKNRAYVSKFNKAAVMVKIVKATKKRLVVNRENSTNIIKLITGTKTENIIIFITFELNSQC